MFLPNPCVHSSIHPFKVMHNGWQQKLVRNEWHTPITWHCQASSSISLWPLACVTQAIDPLLRFTWQHANPYDGLVSLTAKFFAYIKNRKNNWNTNSYPCTDCDMEKTIKCWRLVCTWTEAKVRRASNQHSTTGTSHYTDPIKKQSFWETCIHEVCHSADPFILVICLSKKAATDNNLASADFSIQTAVKWRKTILILNCPLSSS